MEDNHRMFPAGKANGVGSQHAWKDGEVIIHILDVNIRIHLFTRIAVQEKVKLLHLEALSSQSPKF